MLILQVQHKRKPDIKLASMCDPNYKKKGDTPFSFIGLTKKQIIQLKMSKNLNKEFSQRRHTSGQHTKRCSASSVAEGVPSKAVTGHRLARTERLSSEHLKG